MIAATKAAQAPGVSLSTVTWLGRFWRALAKTSNWRIPSDGSAAKELGFPAAPATLTQGYLQTLNALHETIEVTPAGYLHGTLADDLDTDDAVAKNDPVAAIIQESLSGLAADPAFRFFDHTYTVRCSCADASSSLEVTKTPSGPAP